MGAWTPTFRQAPAPCPAPVAMNESRKNSGLVPNFTEIRLAFTLPFLSLAPWSSEKVSVWPNSVISAPPSSMIAIVPHVMPWLVPPDASRISASPLPLISGSAPMAWLSPPSKITCATTRPPSRIAMPFSTISWPMVQ